ncbi:MAG: nucleotidyl transferase AbiEii/AbiGii toxin family protein [Solirubrobacterales bacterium]
MTEVSDTVYRELQRRAAEFTNGVTQVQLEIYLHERFLARLAQSPYVENFTLKGGMLLASRRIRPATRDADVLVDGLELEAESLTKVLGELIAIQIDDGVVFDPSTIRAEPMREAEDYPGLRFSVDASISTAKLKLKVDMSTGDPVDPTRLEISPMLGGDVFAVNAYGLETVLAEKIETILSRGDANTRMRDFADVMLIAASGEFNEEELRTELARTAAHRGTELVPVEDVLITLPTSRQVAWQRYLEEGFLEDRLPEDFSVVVSEVADFVRPLVETSAPGAENQL